jgi:hypothetical protein
VSLPAGYVRWCQAQGLNPWHPDEWPAEGLKSFQAWKQELASVRFHQLVADGRWNRLSLDRQAEVLLEHAAFVQAPPPSRPYTSCPCHAYTPAYSGPLAALPSTIGACLTWLEQTFSGRPIRRLRRHR